MTTTMTIAAAAVNAARVRLSGHPPALSAFLAAQQGRALRWLQWHVGSEDEALDILQDAMIALARHYAHQDAATWPALLYRILQNRLKRWRVGKLLQGRWLGRRLEDDIHHMVMNSLPAPESDNPEMALQQSQTLAQLHLALRRLPAQQQSVFLLRHWQDLSTEQTAEALGISAGSVKTQLSRAVQKLQQTQALMELKP